MKTTQNSLFLEIENTIKDLKIDQISLERKTILLRLKIYCKAIIFSLDV